MIDALELGAVPRTVPLREHRYDLEAMLDSIGERTKIVYVCHPNNPTGTMSTRAELDAYFDAVPDHVLAVLDQAYFSTSTTRTTWTGWEYVEAGRRAVRPADVLEDLRARRAAGGLRRRPGRGRDGDRKVRRAFDVNSAAQSAACASLDAPDELARRRRVNADRIRRAQADLAGGLDPPGSVANSSSPRSARTPGRCSSNSCGKA